MKGKGLEQFLLTDALRHCLDAASPIAAMATPVDAKIGSVTINQNNVPGVRAHHPAAPDRGSALLQALEGFDDAFAAALDAERLAPPAPPQERDALF